MKLARREALTLSVAGIAAGLLAGRRSAPAAAKPRIRAVALDAFTTFDPWPIAALAERLFPGKGPALISAWRTRQFEYSWLRTLMGRYASFWQVAEEALVFAARMLGLELTDDKRSRLMQGHLEIAEWPDARPALESLRGAGIRLAFLSNFTPPMLDAAVRNAGLEGLFEPHLSTDRVRAFKPDPRAYRMGTEAFGLAREEIVFAAFGGWDAAGAKVFGYPTFWVNRAAGPVEELGVAPDGIGATLGDLAEFVRNA
jgi:2-haloacid dehalogenase